MGQSARTTRRRCRHVHNQGGYGRRGAKVVGAAPITPEQRDADEWVEAAAKETLPRIRDLAARWGATVTALTGLFGVGALISGDATVRALRLAWRIGYGCLALGALSAAAVSILAAALASQATVSRVGPDIHQRVDERERRIAGALVRLRWSRVTAAVALVLGMAALAIRWYAPS